MHRAHFFENLFYNDLITQEVHTLLERLLRSANQRLCSVE